MEPMANKGYTSEENKTSLNNSLLHVPVNVILTDKLYLCFRELPVQTVHKSASM